MRELSLLSIGEIKLKICMIYHHRIISLLFLRLILQLINLESIPSNKQKMLNVN